MQIGEKQISISLTNQETFSARSDFLVKLYMYLEHLQLYLPECELFFSVNYKNTTNVLTILSIKTKLT